MVTPTALLRQPSDLDLTEVTYFADGRREYRIPDVGRAAAEREQWDAFYRAQAAEKAHEEQIQARVKEVIEAGPPSGEGASPLERHLSWLTLAQRRLAAAEARCGEAAAVAASHEAAKDAYAVITTEVYEAAQAWVRYATSRDPDDDDLRPMPDTRQAVLAELESEIAATRAVHDVLPSARFEAEVAGAVVAGLQLIGPFRRAEDVIARELPRLTTLLDAAVQDVSKIYGHMASLDELAVPDWETATALRALGVEPPARLVHPGTTVLPSVGGRKVKIEVAANPCATTRYRAASAAPGTAVALISPPPSSEPTSRIARAIKLFTGE
jgi:hypothetical protein